MFELESYFAESNTSYSAYKKRLEGYNDILQENDIIRMYLDYRFNVEREFEIEKIQIAFMFDSQLSIVDMYETFVLAEQLMFTEGIEVEEKFVTSDFRQCNLNLIETPERICDYNQEYYKLLELYTCGKYQEYIEQCEQYLLKVPQDFQSIILLVKSYIFLNKKMEIGKKLCKWLYDVYSLNGKEAEAIQELFSYLKVVRFTSWEYKIMGFIARKTTMPQRKKMSFLSMINDVCISPNIVNNECFNGNAIEFLDSFANICPITQKLYLYKLGIGVFPIAILDENRSLFFEADKLIDASKNDEALDILTSISRTDNYFLERILRRKIRIYEQKEDCLAEVECVTNAILRNNNLQKRIDLPEVLKHVNSHLSKDIKRNIHYVVFTYLCMPSDYNKQRIAYSNYMDYNKYKSIYDIVSNEEKNAVLIEFLSKVCIQHILKRDIILNPGGNKADELRVEILKVLIDIDERNRKKYYAEIAAITKQKSIKDRIKQINQSRVFVDTDNIKKENESTLREDFNRYLAMKDLDEGLISYDIYNEDYISDLKKIVDEINEKIKTNAVYSQKMIILKGIITTITEEFLFNEKYGLNTFLSSRIRHGYCKKQLTTVFQEYNLLSKKKKNNSEEYLINEYWDGILPENAKGSGEIKKYLSKFTLNIEKKVDDIKKNWLSIKYREENESILDYTLCVNQCLLIDMDNIIDFNTFYDEIIELLWKYTLGHFAVLREKIAQQREMGMAAATNLTQSIIYHFKPSYIIMVGIAAGIGDGKNLGDIIVATEVWNYSSGKYITDENGKLVFSPDPKHIILDPNMESVLKRDYSAELYNIRKQWNEDIHTDLKLVLGPLACGAAVVGNSEIVDDMIKQHSRKTIGLDMESYGMFYATNYGLDSGTIPICLKSISDFADEKKGDGYQKYAAYTSAKFARYLIESVLSYINE